MLRGGPVRSSDAVPSGGCSLTASLPPGGGSSSARTEPAVRTVRGSAPPGLQGVEGGSGCPEAVPAVTWLYGGSRGHPGWEHVGVTPLFSGEEEGFWGGGERAVPGPSVTRVCEWRCEGAKHVHFWGSGDAGCLQQRVLLVRSTALFVALPPTDLRVRLDAPPAVPLISWE